MKLSEEEKNDYLLRIKMHLMFIELFIDFHKDDLDVSEIKCLNDVSYCLKDLTKLFNVEE